MDAQLELIGITRQEFTSFIVDSLSTNSIILKLLDKFGKEKLGGMLTELTDAIDTEAFAKLFRVAKSFEVTRGELIDGFTELGSDAARSPIISKFADAMRDGTMIAKFEALALETPTEEEKAKYRSYREWLNGEVLERAEYALGVTKERERFLSEVKNLEAFELDDLDWTGELSTSNLRKLLVMVNPQQFGQSFTPAEEAALGICKTLKDADGISEVMISGTWKVHSVTTLMQYYWTMFSKLPMSTEELFESAGIRYAKEERKVRKELGDFPVSCVSHAIKQRLDELNWAEEAKCLGKYRHERRRDKIVIE